MTPANPFSLFRGALFIAASLAAAASTDDAAAAEADDENLEEIVVTARSIEETIPLELRQFGNRLHIISAEDMELGGFVDLGQSLQMEVPGLYIAPRSGAFDYMNCSLQGSRCEDILWLIDGVRINNRLYNTTGPLDTIPAHIVERVEVLYGGQGIFYGTQSVAGVVNVVTKRFAKEPSGSLELGVGGEGGYHVNGDYRGSLGSLGEHRFVVYASMDKSDGYQPFADSAYQKSATDRERGYDVLTLGGKYARQFGNGARLSVLFQNTRNEVDNLVPYGVAIRNNARDEDLVTAKWDQALGDNADFYLKAWYHDWNTEWDEIFNDVDDSGELTGTRTVRYLDTFWGFEDYGVSASGRLRTGHGFDYVLGYDYQRFRGNDEVWLIEDQTESVHAAYAQIRTSDALFDNSHAAFGMRYNATSGKASATIWNLSGKHAFNDRLYARATLGTSFRLPDAEELYLKDCCEAGNPNLEPEESRNAEFAIGGTAPVAHGLRWELIGFAREVDNLIAVEHNNPAFPGGRYENFDTTVEFSGWEAFLALSAAPGLDLSFDYTNSRAEPEGGAMQMPDIPESIAKIAADYRAERLPLELSFSLVAVGDVYDVVGGENVDIGGYRVVDLSMAWLPDADRRHRIGLRLENALDETWATAAARGFADAENVPYVFRYLGMPRTLHVSYRYRF